MVNHEFALVMLISGSGSTAEAVLHARERGELDGIRPVAVIASRPDAKGLEKARAYGVSTHVIDRSKYQDRARFGQDLLKLLTALKADIVSQNGWMPITPANVVQAYEGRIINQHPGPLDPGRAIDFGGKGMHGTAVTCARLAYAWTAGEGYWTEATVHHVVEGVDKGDIIAVSTHTLPHLGYPTSIALLHEDPGMLMEMTRSIQADLLPQEHALVVDAFRAVGATRSFPLYERSCPLVPEQYMGIAQEAKELAVSLFP